MLKFCNSTTAAVSQPKEVRISMCRHNGHNLSVLAVHCTVLRAELQGGRGKWSFIPEGFSYLRKSCVTLDTYVCTWGRGRGHTWVINQERQGVILDSQGLVGVILKGEWGRVSLDTRGRVRSLSWSEGWAIHLKVHTMAILGALSTYIMHIQCI